jgi:hypothetical protein
MMHGQKTIKFQHVVHENSDILIKLTSRNTKILDSVFLWSVILDM